MDENTKNMDRPLAMDASPAETRSPDRDSADREAGKAVPSDTPAATDSTADTPAPADLPVDTGAVPSDSAELSALREELTRLRGELERKQEITLRLGRECAEFQELYPGVPLSAIPDDTWDAVKAGIPLSAAYALSERKRMRLEETARESNRQNRMRSAGEIGQDMPGYFSYEEVRRMSRAEIRENYNNILLSMQKWH